MRLGANVHMLADLAGIFSRAVIFHIITGSMRKGSFVCQTRDTLKHRLLQLCPGFEGLGLCLFL